MVPGKFFIFKKNSGEQHENGYGQSFLDSFKLNKIKGAAIFFVSNPVSGDLEKIFEKCQFLAISITTKRLRFLLHSNSLNFR